jgi:predicted nucleic acid-binding protein
VRGAGQEEAVEAIIEGLPLLPLNGLDDFHHAAMLYRAGRAGGETVRRMTDCLVAAVAIRNDVPVLHNDRDYAVLARYTPLRVV